MKITICRWREFQHYSKRSPPWIKVHRKLLDNRQWGALPDSAARLLVECWLIASETEAGEIDADLDDLAWRLRKQGASAVLADLNVLVDNNFIEIDTALASNTLA